MRKTTRTLPAFSIVEMMVSMFIFALIMVAVSQIFSTSFRGYLYTKNLQKDVENSQYVLSLFAKELRTSTVVSPTGTNRSVTTVKFFDHSQDLCIQYRINGTALEVAKVSSADPSNCSSQSPSPFSSVATGIVSGRFFVTSSQPRSTPAHTNGRIGKVTIALRIQTTSLHTANLQTTISLRDFGEVFIR